MSRPVACAFVVLALLGVARGQDALREARVVRFDPEASTVVLAAGGREHAFRVTGETRFDGKAGVVSPRTARLFLHRGVSVGFAAGADDALTAVRFDPVPHADTSRMKPLPELGADAYGGRPGGLYPDGKNERPLAHERAGLALAAEVRPLDESGRPSGGGRVVLLSVGMSNCTQEFSAFKALADRDSQRDPRVLLVDGAQGGMTAARIQDPESPEGRRYWATSDERLASVKATPAQVQAVWLKEADMIPDAGFPEYAQALQSGMRAIVRFLPRHFPNVKLAYLSCRTYGGYATTMLNPEPYAYESGFSVKWLVEEQIRGLPGLSPDASKGPREAPWLSWGPYLWANGETPNSEGLSFAPEDFVADGTHPSARGQRTVAERLLRFFRTDSTAKPWFLGR